MEDFAGLIIQLHAISTEKGKKLFDKYLNKNSYLFLTSANEVDNINDKPF